MKNYIPEDVQVTPAWSILLYTKRVYTYVHDQYHCIQGTAYQLQQRYLYNYIYGCTQVIASWTSVDIVGGLFSARPRNMYRTALWVISLYNIFNRLTLTTHI